MAVTIGIDPHTRSHTAVAIDGGEVEVVDRSELVLLDPVGEVRALPFQQRIIVELRQLGAVEVVPAGLLTMRSGPANSDLQGVAAGNPLGGPLRARGQRHR